jgi:hypothetical protein
MVSPPQRSTPVAGRGSRHRHGPVPRGRVWMRDARPGGAAQQSSTAARGSGRVGAAPGPRAFGASMPIDAFRAIMGVAPIGASSPQRRWTMSSNLAQRLSSEALGTLILV